MLISIHPDNPQPRLVQKAVDALKAGQLVVYPTDSTYAFGWLPSEKAPQERIARLRRLDEKHLYAIACRDVKQAAEFGKIDNSAFGVIKKLAPGPYTFVLAATKQLPKRLYETKRRTIGIRIPQHRIVQAILAELEEPLMTSSIPSFPGLPSYYDSEELFAVLAPHVDLMIDGGACGHEPTTLLDLSQEAPVVLRLGKGAVDDVL
jgi:tRNA threonylcarbamoyl adenosine modification protein (Sua5/YciO/YrdC/YwlC family)